MRILHVLPAILSAVLAAGCGPLPVEAFREALPEEEALTIRMGQQDAAASALASALLDPNATCPECCVAGEGDDAAYVTGDLYAATRAAIHHVNGGLAVAFGWIRLVSAYPPSSLTADSATWGPWDDTKTDPLSRLSLRFLMERVADGAYDFRLEARSVNATTASWEAIAWGTVAEGDAPHRGQGTLDLDFDLLHALDAAHPSRLYGQVHYDFDVRHAMPTMATPNTVTATFTDFYEKAAWGNEPTPMDATYRYWRFDELAGKFAYEATTDVAGPEGVPDGVDDTLAVEARWTAVGKGRAEASVTTGAFAGFTAYQLEECWADRAGLYYQTWRRDTATPTAGTAWSEIACGVEDNCPTF